MESKKVSRKRKISGFALTALIVLLIAAVSVSGIAAYTMTRKSKMNVISIGGCTTVIQEKYNPPKELIPGVEFQKQVTVKNVGPGKCFVRCKVIFPDSDVEAYSILDWNTTDWTYNADDGYWYYPTKITTGESTTPLFNKVTINPDVAEGDIRGFDISIYSESVEVGGADDYTEAWNTFQHIT